VRIADLFAGCGAMSLGLQEAARRIGRRVQVRLAVDIDKTAIKIYAANLPVHDARAADVTALFDGKLGAAATKAEKTIKKKVGSVDVLLGGPPCEGHSDLNNHTRRRDPKNVLYLRMARAAEVLAPKVVIIENVAAVQLDETRVVNIASNALRAAGYQVAGRVVDLRRVGVPQRRRRFVLLASKVPDINPASILERLATGMPDHRDRTVRWAIGDLLGTPNGGEYDTSGRITKRNARRVAFLFERNRYNLPNRQRPACHRDGGHTYKSMYGRLHWDMPAQTITTGFGSMGQGRYVHPARRRTITPHEAARLQTFPDSFNFGDTTSRKMLAKLIGNAVPPLFMVALGTEVLRRLDSGRRRRRGTPAASSPGALHRMLTTRRRDTPGEVAIRHLLHASRLRFWVDRQVLPGSRRRADIVFARAKVAVFIDGCFWHSCPVHRTKPKANAAWWAAKLAANRRRDADTNRQLRNAGWLVERVWEHEAPEAAAARIEMMVRARLHPRRRALA
jgi:DNA (cytosine-5)-methyltransferase 1